MAAFGHGGADACFRLPAWCSMVKVGVCVFARALVCRRDSEIVGGSPLSTPWSPCSLAS
ncbi:MAG: hypothetical protein ACLU37_04490 [Collinsella sp.]